MIYDIAIVGLGPSGIELAKKALSKDLSVIAFEKSSVGGTCLNLGCIPTKTMLSATEVFSKLKKFSKPDSLNLFKDNQNIYFELCKKNNAIVNKLSCAVEKELQNKGLLLIKEDAKISFNEQQAPFISAADKLYNAKRIFIATGSKPVTLDLDCSDGELIYSDDLLKLDNLPKSILIVGSGAIGIEWARILNSLGVEVTLIEKAKTIAPLCDIDVSARIERILKISKIKYYKDVVVTSFNSGFACLSNGLKVKCDKILCAIGRKPYLPQFEGNFKLKIFDDCTTNIDNLYVIGDAYGSKMLAHFASHQACALFEHIYEGKKFVVELTPSVIYGSPEIASIGVNEQDIPKSNDYRIYKLPISYLPKSWCDDETDGFIKIITKNNFIVGAHIVSKEASALITQIAIAIKAGINVDELKDVVFPHPTYSEGILEALNYG